MDLLVRIAKDQKIYNPIVHTSSITYVNKFRKDADIWHGFSDGHQEPPYPVFPTLTTAKKPQQKQNQWPGNNCCY